MAVPPEIKDYEGDEKNVHERDPEFNPRFLKIVSGKYEGSIDRPPNPGINVCETLKCITVLK